MVQQPANRELLRPSARSRRPKMTEMMTMPRLPQLRRPSRPLARRRQLRSKSRTKLIARKVLMVKRLLEPKRQRRTSRSELSVPIVDQ